LRRSHAALPIIGPALFAALWIGACHKPSSDATRPPACRVATDSLDFGNVVIGDARTLPLTVSNLGGQTLRVGLRSPCAEFVVDGDTSLDVGAGQSRSFRVTFIPTAEGDRSCTLGGPCDQVPVSGFGASRPCLVTPDHLDFASVPVNGSADRYLTVRNAGRTLLSGVIYSPCPDFAVLPSAYDIPAGASVSIRVRFAPNALGPSSCVLQMGNADCADVPCAGEGAVPFARP